jgi:putative FmdB family regulatory protein
MPIYEYRCTKCGHRWSTAESVADHDRSHPACPQCRSRAVAQVVTPFFAKTVRKS